MYPGIEAQEANILVGLTYVIIDFLWDFAIVHPTIEHSFSVKIPLYR